MSEMVEIPSYARAKSGEEMSPQFLAWVAQTKRKLLRAFPKGERAFCKIFDKWRSRMPRRWKNRILYTRQKYFTVAPGVVFFGDFYFPNLKLLIEIDGNHHSGPLAREKDEWRTKLIGAWGVRVERLKNEQVIDADFVAVEKLFSDWIAESCPPGVRKRFRQDIKRMQRDNEHIYVYRNPPASKV